MYVANVWVLLWPGTPCLSLERFIDCTAQEAPPGYVPNPRAKGEREDTDGYRLWFVNEDIGGY